MGTIISIGKNIKKMGLVVDLVLGIDGIVNINAYTKERIRRKDNTSDSTFSLVAKVANDELVIFWEDLVTGETSGQCFPLKYELYLASQYVENLIPNIGKPKGKGYDNIEYYELN